MDNINDRIRQYLDEEGIIPKSTSGIIGILGDRYQIYQKLEREKEKNGNRETDLRFYQFLAEKLPGLNIPTYDLLRSPLRKIIEFNLDYAAKKISPTDTVLSVGSNTGLYETFLAQLAKKMIYLDLSKEQMTIARERANRRGLGNTVFRVADMDSTNLMSNEVDVLLCIDALKEMSERDVHPLDSPYLDERIKEFRRVLKRNSNEKNGKLIISATCEVSGFNPNVHDYLRREAEKLRQKLEKNGFAGEGITEKYWSNINLRNFVSLLYDLQVRD